MKIFTVVGARPNFMKVDPELPQTLVHTGQHYDYRMSKVFFEGLKLPEPEYNLNCTEVGQMIDKLRALFRREEPDLILVMGDTNSALAGALAATLENIRLAHVEAGLRSYDMTMPEEKNRVLIDKVASVLFCPSQGAALNLLKEGIKDNVHIVGDPLLDAMGRFLPIKKGRNYRKYVLLTMHRNFNVDNTDILERVLKAIGDSGERAVFPVHPRTRKMLRTLTVPKNIKLIPPQGYKEMLRLISDAKKVITDSGGVQREAAWMQVPVIILRDTTEWTDLVGRGAAILVGTRPHDITTAIRDFNGSIYSPPEANANERIKSILYRYV